MMVVPIQGFKVSSTCSLVNIEGSMLIGYQAIKDVFIQLFLKIKYKNFIWMLIVIVFINLNIEFLEQLIRGVFRTQSNI